jgi:hypothetical protein
LRQIMSPWWRESALADRVLQLSCLTIFAKFSLYIAGLLRYKEFNIRCVL